jgi:hypothetical protein
MPFTRLPELRTLAASIHSAMDRNDDIGMDMLRDMLPELRETIEAVNTALREVDGLLFEGRRDEAVTLNDPEFPALAARLHLQDRAGWPEAESFFTAEGINMPPKIDFDTLNSMESAHMELERLRRPLDALRRLNLERAPLERRLAALRKLRQLDPTKPVWADSIAAHEEARVGELHGAVLRAVEARDPATISALHAELVDPEWGIPVPRDLIRDTRGADVWQRMREAVAQAEEAAAALEAGQAEVAEAPPAPDLVGRQKQARQTWLEADATARECVAALADCPRVAAIVSQEGLESRLAALAPRVRQPLQWLAAEDARETNCLQHRQLCGQLDYLCDRPPSRKGDELNWLAGVGRLETELMRCCQTDPTLGYPDLLRERVRGATAAVKAREIRRRRFKAAVAASGVLVLCGLLWGVRAWANRGATYSRDLAAFEEIATEAEKAAYAGMPAEAEDIFGKYPGDSAVARLKKRIAGAAERERDRRSAVDAALVAFDQASSRAREALDRREGDQDKRLDAWDPAIVDAADAWRDARKRGGLPAKRQPEDTEAAAVMNRPALAMKAFEDEERRIDEARRQQEDLEVAYGTAAVAEFRRQKDAIQAAFPPEDAPDRAQVAGRLLQDLGALIQRGKERKVDRVEKLLGDPQKKGRVPFTEIEAARLLQPPLEAWAK